MNTLYSDDTARIAAAADDANGTPLTDGDLTVLLTIYDLNGTTVLLNNAVMTWDPDVKFPDRNALGGWAYIWQTPHPAGAYRARIVATGGGMVKQSALTIRARAFPTGVAT